MCGVQHDNVTAANPSAGMHAANPSVLQMGASSFDKQQHYAHVAGEIMAVLSGARNAISHYTKAKYRDTHRQVEVHHVK